jgi:hypothetical protein
MRFPTEKEKTELMKTKIELMRTMMINGQVDVNWAIKNILGFDKKSEYRKHKIDNIFNG